MKRILLVNIPATLETINDGIQDSVRKIVMGAARKQRVLIYGCLEK